MERPVTQERKHRRSIQSEFGDIFKGSLVRDSVDQMSEGKKEDLSTLERRTFSNVRGHIDFYSSIRDAGYVFQRQNDQSNLFGISRNPRQSVKHQTLKLDTDSTLDYPGNILLKQNLRRGQAQSKFIKKRFATPRPIIKFLTRRLSTEMEDQQSKFYSKRIQNKRLSGDFQSQLESRIL